MAAAAALSAGLDLSSKSCVVPRHRVPSPNTCPFIVVSPYRFSVSLQVQHAVSDGKINVAFTNEATESREDIDDEDEPSDREESWQTELLDELNPLLYLQPHNPRKARRRKNVSGEMGHSPLSEAGAPEWAERARQRALRSLETRNPVAANLLKKKVEPNSNGRALGHKQKKKKKKNSPANALVHESAGLRKTRLKGSLKNLEQSSRLHDSGCTSSNDEADSSNDWADDEDDLDGIDSIDDLPIVDSSVFGRWNTNSEDPSSGNKVELDSLSTSKAFVPALAKAAEQGSDRERIFNKQIVGAKTALEVLEVVGNAEERSRLLRLPSLLTPLNAATALHRIGKHMEMSGTLKAERLDFARKRYMAKLVASSMAVLADSSAQGLSNIAWALSKIGGRTLYYAEMDLVANAVLPNVSAFNSQNVANILGAYASMQHASPVVFASLCKHAVDILDEFSSQELAQVLWAHAELMQPVDPLLDALDGICLSSERGLSGYIAGSDLNSPQSEHLLWPTNSIGRFNLFGNASAEHLTNLGWSYAVLDQVNRPAFKHLWEMLESILTNKVNSTGDLTSGLSEWHLAQIHQVNLCLQYGYSSLVPPLKLLLKDAAELAWESQKRNIWSPSEYQKDVKWCLVSMGQDWVEEYFAADYSLDLALPKKRIAIEIDGPSHFIRNNGLPLGHTILKRRLLSQSGWTVLPISYERWEELDGETEQMNFMKELLRTDG